MKLTKSIIFFDIESGCPGLNPDPARDKIVTLAAHKIRASEKFGLRKWYFNPGFAMRPENIECHGITNEVAAGFPLMTKEHALDIHQFLKDCDLGGFNILNYDVPLLWEECYRVGVELDFEGVAMVDVGNIFKMKEERSLSAAVKFYCGREHKGAHDASNDVDETVSVFEAQLLKYPDLGEMSIPDLAKFSQFDPRVDLAGKIVLNDKGIAVYNFGNSKGVPVVDDQGFARWMLGKDFSENTKRALRKILGYESPPEQQRMGW